LRPNGFLGNLGAHRGAAHDLVGVERRAESFATRRGGHRRPADCGRGSGFGGEAMMTSDKCRSGTDRVAEVARKIKAGLYLNIQGDEPLMTERTLRKVLALHTDRSVCLGTVATVLAPSDWGDPNAVKVLVDKRGIPFISPAPLCPTFRDGAPKAPPPNTFLFKHLGVYSYRPETLRAFVRWPAGFFETAEKLEQLRALENGVRIRVAVTPDDSIGVDLPGDVARVEKILKRRGTTR
jgi:3-deoxy-manno-octulosonate cytidylyltransferase (CMP-KDO synthetase)